MSATRPMSTGSRKLLATQLGATADLVFVQADICRADLLLEIEATAIHATAR